MFREHNALLHPGRARGVDQHLQRVRVTRHGGIGLVAVGVQFASLRHQDLIGQEVAEILLTVNADKIAHLRHLGGMLHEVVLIAFCVEYDLTVAVVYDVHDVRKGKLLVDRYIDAARLQHGEVDHDPVVGVLAHHRDVTVAHTERGKRRAQCHRVGVEPAVGHILDFAVLTVLEGYFVARLFDGKFHHFFD